MTDRRIKLLLLASVFVIATCGLIYELIAGTLASYLLGDSVTQFSTIIGVYLFAMGIGSYLSKFVRRNEIGLFIQVELLVGLIGGASAGAFTPHQSRMVGVRSTHETIASHAVPGRFIPGARTMSGRFSPGS